MDVGGPPIERNDKLEQAFWVAPGEQDRKPGDERDDPDYRAKGVNDEQLRDRDEKPEERA